MAMIAPSLRPEGVFVVLVHVAIKTLQGADLHLDDLYRF
jgi:hypothetical protein